VVLDLDAAAERLNIAEYIDLGIDPLNLPGGDDHPYLACQLSVF
jgi:hypothetical protein